MAGKDVIVQEGGELELSDEQRQYMDELARDAKSGIDMREDITLPALKLVQATSSDVGDARKGEIYHSLSGESYKTAEFLIITTFKTRTYWGNREELGGPPVCFSDNALDGWGSPTPEEVERDGGEPYGHLLDVKGPNGGGSCRSCPKSLFGAGCQEQYNYLGYVIGEDGIDGQLPAGVLMKRTSVKVAKRLNALILNMKYPWSNVIELNSVEDENKAGQKYQVWSIKKGRPATMDEMVYTARTAAQLRDARAAGQRISVDDADPDGSTSGTGTDDIPF